MSQAGTRGAISLALRSIDGTPTPPNRGIDMGFRPCLFSHACPSGCEVDGPFRVRSRSLLAHTATVRCPTTIIIILCWHAGLLAGNGMMLDLIKGPRGAQSSRAQLSCPIWLLCFLHPTFPGLCVKLAVIAGASLDLVDRPSGRWMPLILLISISMHMHRR